MWQCVTSPSLLDVFCICCPFYDLLGCLRRAGRGEESDSGSYLFPPLGWTMIVVDANAQQAYLLFLRARVWLCNAPCLVTVGGAFY